MFSKLPHDQSGDYSHTFFRRFNALVRLYTVVNGKRDMRLSNGRVLFTTEKKNYDFFIQVQSADLDKAKDKYLFPVSPAMDIFV